MQNLATTRFGFLDWHYFRNIHNDPSLATNKVSDFDTKLHRLGEGSQNNIKFISPNGNHEAVYNNGERVGGINRATYNYSGAIGLSGRFAHTFTDVLPFAILGH